MDTTTVQAASQIADPAIIGGVIALALGLVEVLKISISWLGRKVTGDKGKHQTLHVQLDPEVSKVIHETGDIIRSMSTVIGRTDSEGVPLVYADRRVEDTVVKLADLMKELAESQRRLAAAVERLDTKFSDHDARDMLTFDRMSAAHTRIEALATQNRESLLLFDKQQESVIRELEAIRKYLTDK